jgi:hypothetical protein
MKLETVISLTMIIKQAKINKNYHILILPHIIIIIEQHNHNKSIFRDFRYNLISLILKINDFCVSLRYSIIVFTNPTLYSYNN